MLKKIIAFPISFSVNQLISAFLTAPHPIEIKPTIQNYEWGQTGETAYIPKLLNINGQNLPWAELWVGIHEKSPSIGIINNIGIALNKIFQNIPWLLKILTSQKMLSVQVHPNNAEAKIGFNKEILDKIPAEKRSYKDQNPKPEIAIPLTDFWAMNGFLPQKELIASLKKAPEIAKHFNTEISLLQIAETPAEIKIAKRNLYEKIMTLSQTEINTILHPYIERLKAEHNKTPFSKTQKEYWILEADKLYTANGLYDVGIFSILMLNLIHLSPYGAKKQTVNSHDAIHAEPGSGMFISAGTPHFYLEGVCIENMINSDNVVRAGLTPKFKDTKELLRIIDYTEKAPDLINPQLKESSGLISASYPNKTNLFETGLVMQKAGCLQTEQTLSTKPKVLVVLGGQIEINWNNQKYVYSKGQCCLIPPANKQNYTIMALKDSVYCQSFEPEK